MWRHKLSAEKQPKKEPADSCQLLINIMFKWEFVFEIIHKYFLKWTWKLTLLTSFTYSLPPSMSNLVNAIATASKQLFTMRPIHVWGCLRSPCVFEMIWKEEHVYFRCLCIRVSDWSRHLYISNQKHCLISSFYSQHSSWVPTKLVYACVHDGPAHIYGGYFSVWDSFGNCQKLLSQKSTRPLIPIQPIVK